MCFCFRLCFLSWRTFCLYISYLKWDLRPDICRSIGTDILYIQHILLYLYEKLLKDSFHWNILNFSTHRCITEKTSNVFSTLKIDTFFPLLRTRSSIVSGAARFIILHRITPSSIFSYISDPSFYKYNPVNYLCVIRKSEKETWHFWTDMFIVGGTIQFHGY